ncbi:LysR family transcriptional regulator [Psychromonas sp. MME2]|uniref:LysR family transcriptional regulator n=1 Tax=unclassified Psychromonas TaxID=2614957 RepID=UPI00339C2D5F
MSTTNQLMLFWDVVQQGSFTKAATLNNLDNSALSKQIKKLESELGVQLLNRSTRSFSLTCAGEEILQEAQTIKNSLHNIQSIARAYQSEPKGILRITSPIYFGDQYLQPVISQFMKKYPQVEIVHALNDRKFDIISGKFDLAFRLGKLADSSLYAKKIADTHFVLLAANSFVADLGSPTTVPDLISLPAVIYSNGDVTLDQLKICNPAIDSHSITYKMTGSYKVSDVRTLIKAVQDGLGYALVDLSNLTKPLCELGLTQLLPDHDISTMDTAIYAIYPHVKRTMITQEFIKAVQAYIGMPARWEVYL